MPSNLDDIHRRLTVLLLKGPRDPRKSESPIYRLSEEIFKKFGFSPSENPVIGVATEVDDTGKKRLVLFLVWPVDGFGDFLTEFLRLEFRIGQVTTGPIIPSARPAVGGQSLGEGRARGESGTFGCLVADAAGGTYLLSCHHVLCRINSGKKGVDPVWQPSHKDGGTTSDRIGVLHDFAPITFGGVVPNEIDAAIASPARVADAGAGLMRLGPIAGTAATVPYRLPVRKVGWKTKETSGTFLYKTAYIQKFPPHGDALFENQLGIVGTEGPFSGDGDSGALVINDKNEAVGLVFAESQITKLTFANPIQRVFGFFGVTPV